MISMSPSTGNQRRNIDHEAVDEISSVPGVVGSTAVEMAKTTVRSTQPEAEPHDLHAVTTTVPAKNNTAWHRFFYPQQHKQAADDNDGMGTSSRRHARTPVMKRKRRTRVPTTDDDDDDDVEENHDPLQAPAAAHHDNHGGDDDSDMEKLSEANSSQTNCDYPHNGGVPDESDPDVKFVQSFWTTYDDILILSIFTQLGIVFRLASSTWFTFFNGVFSQDSPLFVNLPLNCLSCFLMGLLCSGERLMEIIVTRFSPPRTQHDVIRDYAELQQDVEGNRNEEGVMMALSPPVKSSLFGLRHRRKRRPKKAKTPDRFISWQPPVHLDEELRDVQLLALERRIRMSKCLVLFPMKKEDVDVMEHYFHQGYKKNAEMEEEDDDDCDDDEEMMNGGQPRRQYHPYQKHRRRLDNDFNDLVLVEETSGNCEPLALHQQNSGDSRAATTTSTSPALDPLAGSIARTRPLEQESGSDSNGTTDAHSESSEVSADGKIVVAGESTNTDFIAEFTTNVQENVQENIERLRRVNLADGWDAGVTPEEMSDDLMLGLRDGFCGALSSFSSWNSAMVSLMRKGQIGEAFVGYLLGLQLPIVAYRFGQHVAVYIFVWRTRRETRVDERRGGYGIRVSIDEESERCASQHSDISDEEEKRKNEMPSIRAVITAIFIMALVTQCTSIAFYQDPTHQQIALSLLFSPLGVFARWRLTKLNKWRPTFPLGTFACNIISCALSGSLGSLLAGNPGPKERIVLVSVIAGFGGTLSSLAAFVVEVLAGVDPILFRFDGMIYAAASIGFAMLVGLIFSASAEWADQTISK